MIKDVGISVSENIFKSITDSEIDYDMINNSSYKNSLKKFIILMNTKYNYINKKILNNNINNVKIDEIKTGNSSWYFPFSNKIRLRRRDHIYHELFHLSSTIIDYDLDLLFSGLSQSHICKDRKSQEDMINFGINEGYTQLLSERYFNVRDPEYSSYETEKFYAYKLEIIIGEYKMANFYFSGNLYGFYNELLKYNNQEKIELLIQLIDYYSDYSYNIIYRSFPFLKNKIIKTHKLISEILIETYYNKLLSEYTKNYDKTLLINKMKRFVKGFDCPDTDYVYYYGMLEDLDNYSKKINENKSICRKKI